MPFSQVLQWFREREAMGKDAKGKAFKLALNSIYGKLAQSIGRPQFRSLAWAGMITSGTRAEILRVLGPAQDAVIAIATDGIYSQRPLDTGAPPLAPDRLGSWEEKIHGASVFLRPGIFWHEGEEPKTRGISMSYFASQREEALAALDRGESVAALGTNVEFGGAKDSVYRVGGKFKRSANYGQWYQAPVNVSLEAAPKRRPDWTLWELDNVESAPYRKGSQV
jgi:hypothetical protein